MAKSDRDFFMKFLDRAVPGSGRLIDSVDSLGDRIDRLTKAEKKRRQTEQAPPPASEAAAAGEPSEPQQAPPEQI